MYISNDIKLELPINFSDVPIQNRLLRIGAHLGKHGKYVWDSSQQEVHGLNHDQGACVVLTLDPDHHHHHTFMSGNHCTERHYALCEANKR